jgi:hypothetical protein
LFLRWKGDLRRRGIQAQFSSSHRRVMLTSQRKLTSLLFVLAAVCGTLLAKSGNNPQPPKFRLPATAAPEHYKVNLTVAPDKDTFTGTIDIVINLKEPNSTIWLNAEKLNLRQATLAT